MSDATTTAIPSNPSTPPRKGSLLTQDARTKKRNAAETRFKAYGMIAISIGLLMLITLVFNIVSRGTGAFQQTFVTLEVSLPADKLDKAGNRNPDEMRKVSTFGYAPLLRTAFEEHIAEKGFETDLSPKEMAGILSGGAQAQLRNFVLAGPSVVGERVEFEFLASGRVDGYIKGRVSRDSIENDKNISPAQLDLVDLLIEEGTVEKRFNLSFITGADSSGACAADWRCRLDLP